MCACMCVCVCVCMCVHACMYVCVCVCMCVCVCVCVMLFSVPMYRFWCIKWLVVIAVTIAFFFIPEGDDFIFSTSEWSVCLSD